MRVDDRAGAFWRWWTAGTTSMVGSAVGAVAGLLGARATLFVFAATLVCAPLVLLLSPVRHLRDLTDHDDPRPVAPPVTAGRR
ncbi:hypothetical protein ACLQ29_28195 [Micromonospora sp. DT228]|uniref:hypothetical protein n=1 Tax=Micromonospora sp. DT228 TaxID=3393443 RepID=UPI003CF91E56